MNPKKLRHSVSVIIPTYKIDSFQKLNFFLELINSIKLSSDSSSTFCIKEVIIVNDSPGSSPSRSLLKQLDQIQGLIDVKFLENEKNRGQAFSRNNGARNATGTYFHFIDQDDKVGYDFYNEFGRLYEGDADFYMSDCVMLDKPDRSFYKQHTKRLIQSGSSLNRLKALFINNVCNSPGQMLIRNDFFWSVGGFPDLKNRGSDDFAFFLRLLGIPHRYIFVENAKLFYRTHIEQASKLLNMRASAVEAFQCLDSSERANVRIIKHIKLLWVFFPVRLVFYKIMFNTFR